MYNLNDLKVFLEMAEDSFNGMTISSQTARNILNAIEKNEEKFAELSKHIEDQNKKNELLNMKIDELESVMFACSCGAAQKN
jgi:predicted ribosome quality control (RQC) complex YloA/Tae2 family protein